jgi:hypothetical protein
MIKLLKYRAALLGVLFGLFGNGLSQLFMIDEMTVYYTALASLLALVVNLLVSFLLKDRWNKAMRNRVKVASVVLFFGLIASVYLHTKYFIECTFPYEDFDGKVSYYIKGDAYSDLGRKAKRMHPAIQSDADLMREVFVSPEFKGKVWTENSIEKNKLKLISSYTVFVLVFVSIVSILTEVLAGRYGKTTAKTMESA